MTLGVAIGVAITFWMWSMALEAASLSWSLDALLRLHNEYPFMMVTGLAPLAGGLTGLVVVAAFRGRGPAAPGAAPRRAVPPWDKVDLPDLPDALLVVDQAGSVVQYNDCAAHLFGDRALKKSSILDIIPGYLDAAVLRPRRCHDGSSLGPVWIARARDLHGDSFDVELSYAEVGDCLRLFVVRDLHEPRLLEQQQRVKDVLLTELRLQAAKAQRSKAAFLGAMGQDLLGPLIGISGFVNVLKRDMELLEDTRFVHDLVRIEEAAEELGTMINRVLDFAQAAGDNDSLVFDQVDLGELLSSVIEECDPWTQRNGNRVELEVSDALDGIETDHVHLHQAMFHLLEASTRAVDCSILKIQVEQRENLVVIDVGIASPGAAATFSHPELALRAASDGQTVGILGGTGLGVAIAKEYIARLEGRMRRFTTPEGWPCFRVVLPVRPPSMSTQKSTQSGTGAGATSQPGGSPGTSVASGSKLTVVSQPAEPSGQAPPSESASVGIPDPADPLDGQPDLDFWPEVGSFRRSWGRVCDVTVDVIEAKPGSDESDSPDESERFVLVTGRAPGSKLPREFEHAGKGAVQAQDVQAVPGLLTDSVSCVVVPVSKTAPGAPWLLARLLRERSVATAPAICIVDFKASKVTCLVALTWLYRPFEPSQLSGFIKRFSRRGARSALVMLERGEDRQRLVSELVRAGWEVRATSDPASARELLDRHDPATVVGDPSLSPGACEILSKEWKSREIWIIPPRDSQGESRVAKWLRDVPHEDRLVDVFGSIRAKRAK